MPVKQGLASHTSKGSVWWDWMLRWPSLYLRVCVHVCVCAQVFCCLSPAVISQEGCTRGSPWTSKTFMIVVISEYGCNVEATLVENKRRFILKLHTDWSVFKETVNLVGFQCVFIWKYLYAINIKTQHFLIKKYRPKHALCYTINRCMIRFSVICKWLLGLITIAAARPIPCAAADNTITFPSRRPIMHLSPLLLLLLLLLFNKTNKKQNKTRKHW